MTGKPGSPHHHGTYAKRARLVRTAAWSDERTVCWRCGLTYREGVMRYGEAGARWQAGHVIDGQVNGELRPEHRTCNLRAGAAYGNSKREPRSEDPYR
jgi:hypothetical protein